MARSNQEPHSIGRIEYIEPNDLNTCFNGIPHPYENYSFSVDLDVKIPERLRRNSENVEEKILKYSTTNGTLNLMGGTNGSLTTNYTNAVNFGEGVKTNECIGVDSIEITYDRHFVPQVHMRFIDARGLSFFTFQEREQFKRVSRMKERNAFGLEQVDSLIGAIFMVPSPIFVLKIRGYYGRTVHLRLERSMVKVSFDNELGNFVIDVDFIGSMFGAYADIPMSFIVLAPYLDYKGAAYWAQNIKENDKFKFDDNGKPVLSLIEYKTLMGIFNKYLTDEGKDFWENSTLGGLASYLEDVSYILEYVADYFKNLCEKLYGSRALIISGDDLYIPISDSRYVYQSEGKINDKKNTILTDIINNKNKKAEEASPEIKEINDKFNSFRREYKSYVSGLENQTLFPDILNNFFKDEEYENLEIYSHCLYSREGKDKNVKIICDFNKEGELVKRKFSLDENKYKIFGGSGLSSPSIGQNLFFNDGRINSVLNNKILANEADKYFKYKEGEERYTNGFFNELLCFPGVGKLISELKKNIKKVESEIEKKLEESEKVPQGKELSNIIGFKPSVKNYMRIIFAHIDTFVHSFYKIFDEEKYINGRTFGELNLNNCSGDFSDDLLNDSTNIVPPFTLFYKTESVMDGEEKRDEFVRPGENINYLCEFNQNNFVELKLVDSIYDALRKYSAIIKAEEIMSGNNVSDSENNGKITSFIKNTLGDFIFYPRNPYLQLLTSGTKEEFISNAIKIFCARLVTSLITWPQNEYEKEKSKSYLEEEIRNFAITEAYNLKMANPQYTETIKEAIHQFQKNEKGLLNFIYSQEDFIFDSNGKYRWKNWEDGDWNYVPLTFDNLYYAENMPGKIDFKENEGGFITSCGKKQSEGVENIKDTPTKNSVFYFEDRRISNEYKRMPLYAQAIDTKTNKNLEKMMGKLANYNPYPVLSQKIEKSEEITWSYVELGFDSKDKKCVYGDFGEHWSYDTINNEDKNPIFYPSKPLEETTVKIDALNFNFSVKYDLNKKAIAQDERKSMEVQSNNSPIVFYNNDLYDAQNKNDIFAKAYVFLWSIPCISDIEGFNSRMEKTLVELLREGAFWWRYCNTNSAGEWEESIMFPKESSKLIEELHRNRGINKNTIFIPKEKIFQICTGTTQGVSMGTGPGMTFHKYSKFENMGNMVIPICDEIPDGGIEGFRPFREIKTNLYSKERIEKMKSFFETWAENSFRKLTNIYNKECLEDKSTIIEIRNSCFEKNPYDSFFSKTLMQNSTIIPKIKELLYTVFTFIDIKNPMSLKSLNGNYLMDRDCIDIKDKSGKKVGNKESSIDFAIKEFYNSVSKFYENQENLDKLSKDISEDYKNKDKSLEKDIKMTIYLSLKNLYERHFCGETPNRWKLSYKNNDFNHFIFTDSYYNDIGNKICLNANFVSNALDKIITTSSVLEKEDGKSSIVKTTMQNRSVFQYICDILENSGLAINAFPLGNAMINGPALKENMRYMFTPGLEFMNKVSNTDLNSDSVFSENYFMCTYPDKPSEHLNLKGYCDGYSYDDDSFTITDDMGGTTYNSSASLPETLKRKTDNGYAVAAFGVSYGKMNQSYFTNMSINMDTFTNTEFSIEAEQDIAVKGGRGPKEMNLYGQSVYSVYSNYGFTISVESMGNMQIMPGMLFQLNNIPMFKGTYAIYSVSHSISKNNMITKFTGGRMKRYTVPIANGGIVSVLNFSKKTVRESENYTIKRDEDYDKYLKEAMHKKIASTDNKIVITMRDLTYSNTALKEGTSNIPSETEEKNLKELANKYLINLFIGWRKYCIYHQYSNTRVIITSGFRTDETQKKISPTSDYISAHTTGWAADMKPSNGKVDEFFKFCCEFLKFNNLKFDQIINEECTNDDGSKSRWVHLGIYQPVTNKQRGQIERYKDGKYSFIKE